MPTPLYPRGPAVTPTTPIVDAGAPLSERFNIPAGQAGSPWVAPGNQPDMSGANPSARTGGTSSDPTKGSADGVVVTTPGPNAPYDAATGKTYDPKTGGYTGPVSASFTGGTGAGAGGTPGAPTKPLSPEEQMRESANSSTVQQLIAATNAAFAGKLSEEDKAAAGREAETKAMQRSQGLIGSPYGTAAVEETRKTNTQIRQSILDQQAAAVAQILTQADDRGIKLAELKQRQYETDYTNWKTEMDKITTEARTEFGDLSKNLGMSWEDYQKKDPEGAAKLLEQTGYDKGMATLKWNAAKKLADQIEWKDPVQTSDGLLFYGKDPKTGEIKQQTIPAEFNKSYQYQITNNGTLLRFNSANGNIEQYLGNGQFGNSNKTDFGGSAQYIKETGGGAVAGGFSLNDPPRLVQNNNPTAFTTAVAKDMGLVLGTDYVQGAPFTDSKGNTLYTAKLLGDPIETTIKGIDQSGLYTADGRPRWSYLDKIPDAKNWNQLSHDQKVNVIQQMYKYEGGKGDITLSKRYPPDVVAIGNAIIEGSQPPDLSRLYGKSADVRAYLADKDYDMTKATLQWQATQKFVAAANSTQQLRMRQAESSVENSLGNLSSLVDTLNADGVMTGFKFVNRASLSSAANGAFGPKVASDAQAVIGQLTLISDELGQTFMGGNSPTDAAFELAKGVLSSEFTKEQFDTQIDLVRKNLGYRKASWAGLGPAGVSGANPYYTPADGSGGAPASGTAAGIQYTIEP